MYSVHAQFFGGDILGTLVSFALLIVFFLFYPRLMIGQIMFKLEKTAKDLEDMSDEAKKFVVKQISAKPDKKLKESIDRFYEFFTITPVDLDPAGIIKRFDHVVMEQKSRFDYFVKQVAPKADKEKQANITMGFAGGISLYDVSKVVRHYVETVRKTKNFQIAMLLQMQMPMIERIAKSLVVGTKTLVQGQPVGDSIGPLVAAKYIGSAKTSEIVEDIVGAKVKYKGRNIFVLKAKGPGGRLGYPGKAITKIASKNKIIKIISVDAAAKLEGEKTGSVAEGIGVAMGGIGVERSYIEGVAVEKKMPLDSIIVKMSQEEAIMPMRKAIKDALPKVDESIGRSIETTKKGSNIILLGVGNTSGVGNAANWVKKVSDWVDKNEKKVKAEEEAEKKKEGRWGLGF